MRRDASSLSARNSSNAIGGDGRLPYSRMATGTIASTCIAAIALAGAGCMVGPDYTRPDVSTPTSFRGPGGTSTAEGQSIADLPWWEVYRDPVLQDLIREAIRNNYDLRIAITRVEQARAIAAQTKSQLYPSVGYSAQAGTGRNEFVGTPVSNGGDSGTSVFGAISATWEIDVWGRIRRLNEAALAEYLATEEARRAVLLSLVSDVAQAYFELVELHEQLEIARRTTESFAESLRIFTLRFQGGTASSLQTSRAEAALASAAATIPSIELDIAQKENQICVLLGKPPEKIEPSSASMDDLMVPEVPPGLPVDLLARRPDLLQAEQLLRAANANIGVAIGNFLPQIGLTAFLGKVSPEVSALTAGSTNAWSIAASAVGPIFTAGRLTAELEQARAVWQEAALRYEQTVINALRDVSDALYAREKLLGVRAEQARSVDAYKTSVKVATDRYIAGKSSYYEVLEAQQQLFPEELALSRTQLNQLVATVALYRALGGGWNLATEHWGTTTPPPTPPDVRAKEQSAGDDAPDAQAAHAQ